MTVCRVADVAAAHALAVRAGGVSVLPPADRPEWGAGLRTAHLRDPEGRLRSSSSRTDVPVVLTFRSC